MTYESTTTREARLRRERGEATKREAPFLPCCICRMNSDSADANPGYWTQYLDEDERQAHLLVARCDDLLPSTGALIPGSVPGQERGILTDAEFAKGLPEWRKV